MSWARKKDGTHRAVLEAFRSRGWSVCDTSRAPLCPDLFAAKGTRTVAIEIKSKTGRPTEAQLRFKELWQGEYYIVRNDGDVELIDDNPSSIYFEIG